MRLTQQQLEAHLWGAANILRGKTAGQDYKNYILSLMFYKRLCDQWENEADEAITELERQQGRGTLWEGQIPDCLHQNHIFRVRANRAMLDPRFFAFVVESDIAKGYFLRVAKRTTNLASINKTQVRAFRFPVPPLPEQERIAEIVTAVKSKLQALVQKEAALQQLKKSLMHDLLTGKVRVNNLGLAAMAAS